MRLSWESHWEGEPWPTCSSQPRCVTSSSSNPAEQVPRCPPHKPRVSRIMPQKRVTRCSTPVTVLILKYCSASFLSSTNITLKLAHESSLYIPKRKRPKLEMGMQRECMASDNPAGWKGKEIAGSIVWTDLHSWHLLPFSWQQDPSV